MQTLKTALFPILVILLAASIVTALLWGVSTLPIADRIRTGVGREFAVSTGETIPSTVVQPSSQETIQAIASFVKVTILGLLKIIVLMGIPGVVTVILVKLVKRNRRQGNEV